MTTKARQLAEFIANADVDSDEIATGAVSASKLAATLDLSGKTISMPDQVTGDLGVADNANFNVYDADSTVSGRIRNWSSPTNSIAIESDPNNTASGSYLTFTVDGSQKMTILGDNVGIGTTDPSKKFAVSSSGANGIEISPDDPTTSTNRILSYNRSTSSFTPLSIGADDIRFYIEDTERMRISSNGKFGIGTPTPGDELTVVGQALFSYTDIAANSSAQYAQVEIQKDDADANWSYLAFHETGSIAWQQGILDNKFVIASTGGVAKTSTDAERFTIDTSGNVGIGTTSPGQKLTVAGGIESTNSQGSVAFYATTAGSYNQQNGTGGTAWAYGSTGGTSSPATAASTTFGFHHWNGSAWSNPLNILTSGNVGIGTASPNSRLEVLGPQTSYPTTRIIGTGSNDNPVLTVETNTDGRDPHIRLLRPTTTQGASLVIRGGADNWLSIHHVTQGADSQLVVHNNGNVGVNKQTPGAKLHIEGDFLIGQQRFREGYVGISSSETRWFKLINYATGAMLIGRAYLTANRFGGYNQTGAYKEYKASISGFSNAIYGPMNTTGDTGEGGVMSLELGTDEHLYLRVNSSIYGGTVYFYLQGYINNWQFDGSTYVTSAP